MKPETDNILTTFEQMKEDSAFKQIFTVFSILENPLFSKRPVCPALQDTPEPAPVPSEESSFSICGGVYASKL